MNNKSRSRKSNSKSNLMSPVVSNKTSDVESNNLNGNDINLQNLSCALCCKCKFNSLNELKSHVKSIESNLKCPICSKLQCICTIVRHIEKCSLSKSKGFFSPLEDDSVMPMILRKEVGTQTIESFPDIHSFGNITCKMVETIDKNGVKKKYPHIIMEAFPRIESQDVSKKTINLKNVTQNPMSSAKDNKSNTSVKMPPPIKSHQNLATNKQLKNIVNTENHDKLNKKETHFNEKNECSKNEENTPVVSTKNSPRDNKLSYKNDHSMPKKRSCSTDTTMSENNDNVMSNKRGVCVDVAVPETTYILKNKLLDNSVTKESVCNYGIVSETSRTISKKECHINKSESKKRIITGNSPIPKKRGRPPGCKNKIKPETSSITEKINTCKGNINSDLNLSQSDSISKKDLARSNNFHDVTLNLQTEENNEDNPVVKEKEEFFCSACKENFTDVVEHLKNYHPNHEVELECDVYQNYKDKLDVTNNEEGSKEDQNRYTVTLNTSTQKDKKKIDSKNSNADNKRKKVSSDNEKKKHKRKSTYSNLLVEKKSDEYSNKNYVKTTTCKSYIQSFENHLKNSGILSALSNCKVVLEKLNYSNYQNNIVKNKISEAECNMNTSVLESNEILTYDEKIVIPNSNTNKPEIQEKALQEKCSEEKKDKERTPTIDSNVQEEIQDQYKCAICFVEFTSLRQSQKHRELHNSKTAFHCPHCPCVHHLQILHKEHLKNEHGKYSVEDNLHKVLKV